MSERANVRYLLNGVQSCDTLDAEQLPAAPLDLAHLERQLIPLLNWVRKLQGKKPIIVPRN